jgi:pimeloyl-ACP methyl ester carboxylesterase
MVAIVQLVLLHSLPLDGTMWAREMNLLPERTIAPTLYGFGESIQEWASTVLELASDGPLVVVGNSVGGSCALEMARQDPDRIQAIVLIGAKAGVRPEPLLRDEAVRILREEGMEEAWPKYWASLFGSNTEPAVVEGARRLAYSLRIPDVVHGVKAFTIALTSHPTMLLPSRLPPLALANFMLSRVPVTMCHSNSLRGFTALSARSWQRWIGSYQI